MGRPGQATLGIQLPPQGLSLKLELLDLSLANHSGSLETGFRYINTLQLCIKVKYQIVQGAFQLQLSPG